LEVQILGSKWGQIAQRHGKFINLLYQAFLSRKVIM